MIEIQRWFFGSRICPTNYKTLEVLQLYKIAR